MMINDRDCDVEPVEESDFADDSEEIWMYVSAQARLSQAGTDTFPPNSEQ